MKELPSLDNNQEKRSRQLHDDAVVVITYGGPFSSPRAIRGWRMGQLQQSGEWIPPTRTAVGDYLVPDMRAGGVDCVVAHAGSEDDLALWLREFQSSGSEIMQATTASDVRNARELDKVSFILNGAGARQGSIESELNRILLFYRAGVRIWSLTHSARNPISGGCGETDGPGLTNLGKLFVQELNKQRIAVDISHISDKGLWDVLDVSTAPIMASHSNSRSVCNHDRNLTDEMIKTIIANDGIVCLNFFPYFVRSENATVEHIVDHIDRIAEIASVDHVGLGPDFCAGRWGSVLQSWWSIGSSDHNAESLVVDYPKGAEDTTKMQNVTCALVKRGYSDEEIRGIVGNNFLRYFEKVVGG